MFSFTDRFNIPTLILADAGSGYHEALKAKADQAIEAGKTLLYFNLLGDVKAFAQMSASANYHQAAGTFFINNYLEDQDQKFHNKYARPDWSEAINQSASVCTVFAPLHLAPTSYCNGAKEAVIASLKAVKNSSQKQNIEIIIDDISHLGDEVFQYLKELALEKVSIVVSCSYSDFYLVQSVLDQNSANIVLMRAGALKENHEFGADQSLLHRLNQLPAGLALTLPDATGYVREIELPYVSRKLPTEIDFANAKVAA